MNITAPAKDDKPSAYTVTIYRDGQPVAAYVPVQADVAIALLEGASPVARGRAGGITRDQVECLGFIRSFIAANHYSPSYREIADGLNLGSTSYAHRRVQALVRRGFLARVDGRARNMEVTAKGLALEL